MHRLAGELRKKDECDIVFRCNLSHHKQSSCERTRWIDKVNGTENHLVKMLKMSFGTGSIILGSHSSKPRFGWFLEHVQNALHKHLELKAD